MVELRRKTARSWLVDYPRAVPLVIFLLIASITAMSLFSIERGESERDRARIQAVSQSIAAALEQRGSTSSAFLRAGAALFGTVDYVDEPLFRRFVDELRFDEEYRGASGIGWAEAVRPDQLAEYRQRIGSDDPGRNGIFPPYDGSSKWIAPVTYLEPRTAGNRAALGFDMYSEAARRTAMERAERERKPTASGRVTLLLPTDKGPMDGFVIYMPVFGQAAIVNSTVGPALKGFIYSPFNAQAFLDAVVALESPGQSGVRLYDTNIAPENLLAEIPPEFSSGNVITRPLVIGDRSLILEVESARAGTLSQLSMATLLFGLLVASLLMIVARLLTQQAIEDRASLKWLQEQNSIRDSLTRELNHRVKNTLANVLSIIAMTKRRAIGLDDFAEGIDGRIRALSATHDLLTQSEWGTTPIEAVIRAELAPYTQSSDQVVTVTGPPVELAPNDALSLGLALHELATNAAKYGALGSVGGQVSISWTLENNKAGKGRTPDRRARVIWEESGGPPVPQTRPRGFGTDLLEKIVAHELDSPVELDFAPGGVRCTLTIPIRTPSDFAIRANR